MVVLSAVMVCVQAREAPWRVELQKQQQEQQQERQERKQRRQQSRYRTQQLRRPAAAAAADGGDGSKGSSVAWRQKALGGTVTVRVGKLKAQRPVRLTNHLGSSSSSSTKARSSSNSSSSSKGVEGLVDSSTDGSSVDAGSQQ